MLLIQFVFLQLCDVLTTLVFLSFGVAEANPVARAVLAAARAHPALGLMGLKTAGVVCGWYAWRSGRHRLLSRINLLFAGCVVWNLVAIVARVT